MEQQKVSLSTSSPEPVPTPGPGDLGYVPPTSLVPLPSQGKVYPPDSPAGGAESVEIRSMTAKDEDILTSSALLKQGRAIGSLLRSCLVNKAIDSESLIVGDRNAILVAIRITGYGPEYRIPVTCGQCDAVSKDYQFNLSDLEITRLGQEPITPGQNLFAHTSPSGQKVVFKLLTGNDERELSQVMDKIRRSGAVEGAVTQRLIASVVSINGETNRDRLAQAIRNMSARDARDLRTKIKDITPGIKMNQEFVCPSCSESSEVDVPMGPEFFWPSR